MFNNPEQLIHFLDFACHNRHPSALYERETQIRTLPLHFQAAAVLMPFDWHNGDACVWLTERSMHLRQHRGQIAFPGGKCDADDDGAEATALRETAEELGIGHDNWHIIGRLRDCYVPTGFVVSPVVALRRRPLPWQPNPHEVAAVFAVPLARVLDPQHYQTQQIQYHQHNLTVHNLPYAGYRIWGATARMLYRLAQIYPQWQVAQTRGGTS